MPNWAFDLYALVTSRVPFPRGLVLLAIVSMTAFLLLHPWHTELTELGLPEPVVLALLAGWLANVSKTLPFVVSEIESVRQAVGTTLLLTLSLSAFFLFAPQTIWVQHALSLFALTTVVLFVWFYNTEGPNGFSWIGRNWEKGQRNAANWHVTSRVGWIVVNESLIRFGSPSDWLVGIVLSNIALHYLTYWTIIATHPYDDAPDQTP